MKRLPFRTEHLDWLEKYGLKNIPADACCYLKFEPGESIIREGDPLLWLLIVVSGHSKVCRSATNGKNLILCFYVSEGTIGEIELLAGKEHATAAMIAISPFECVAVDYQLCIRELETNVVFSRRLGYEMAQKMIRNDDRLLSSALCTGEQRLCSYILQNSDRGLFTDILTDTSCSIGVSYRHLLRMLNQLCADKILEKRKSGFYILNEEDLVHRSCDSIERNTL